MSMLVFWVVIHLPTGSHGVTIQKTNISQVVFVTVVLKYVNFTFSKDSLALFVL
jgi:hypothetical protein